VRPNSAAVTISTDDFVFGSEALDDVEGTDDNKLMFFDKSKGAFRAGKSGLYDHGGEWDDTMRGNYSTAFGIAAQASGESSMAWGGTDNPYSGEYDSRGGTATGTGSTAWGMS